MSMNNLFLFLNNSQNINLLYKYFLNIYFFQKIKTLFDNNYNINYFK